MPSHDRAALVPRRLTRRGFLRGTVGSTGLLLLTACGGATQAPAPKPTETKPAAQPAATTAPAAKPTEATKPAAGATAQTGPAAKGPVNLKGTVLTVLHDSSFIPQADPFFKKQIEEQFMKDTGAQVAIEFINQNDIAAKVSAAIQSGSGPDIVEHGHGWAHIYQEGLVDVSDVAEDLKRTTGDFYPQVEAYTRVGGKYLTVPRSVLGLAYFWRKSWFTEAGAATLPETYDALHAVGAKLKANGHPLGQCLGHSVNDPNVWCYPMMWAYGGREVDEQGRVAINSPETVAAVKEMAEAWRPAYDETGLSWDDSSNNRAFLAETIAGTTNGASIYWVANNDKVPFLEDINLGLPPSGPKGRVTQGIVWSQGIFKYSRNVDAAKEFLRWSMSPEVWQPWFEVGQGFYNGVGPKQDDNPLWDKFDPKLKVLKNYPSTGRSIGWPGPADQKASLALAKYIVVDMFARAVQGESPEAAVAWAETEMKQIYGA